MFVLATLAASLGVAATPGVAGAQASVAGEWKLLPYRTPINPIHVGLLRTGKVLIASGSENDPTHTTYRAAVWDPGAGSFSVQTIPWDLFCNAMSFLPDGRVLITGGSLQYNPFRGLRTTTIFDPAAENFIQVQDMARGRWYPSTAALSDGKTMTFSGWLETAGVPNQAVELYDVPTGWSPEFMAPWTPPLYPWLHLLPNGKVFFSGSAPDSRLFDPATKTWTASMARTIYARDRRYGSSVLLPLRPEEGYRARVMIMGGNNPATATAEIIALSAGTPAWRALPPMSAPRIEMNAVILPTGKILALGGSAVDNDASTASLGADLFDPATETWSSAGRAAVPRLYHSVALLLPDATVWVAGSNPFQGAWDNRLEIYSPAYLFTTDANGNVVRAPRPTITSVPARVGYDASFQVQTPNAANIASVALVRPGSSTHAFDFDQRLVDLNFTAGSGVLTVTSPPNSNIAPPGYYMVFLVDKKGVPSIAKFVQVSFNPTNQPPRGMILNPTPTTDVTIKAGQSVTFSGDGTDADGSVATLSWVFPGGAPATSKVPTPGEVTFPTPGTYIVSLTATDNLGDNDPSPPTRTITVQAPVFSASFTNPPAGATVNGTQTVAMAVSGGGTPNFTYRLKIDGTEVFTTTTPDTSATYNWNTTTVPNGAHTLTLTVTDATGQTSTATRTVSVSQTGAITVALTTPTPGQTVSGTTWVNVWVSGAAGPYNFTLKAAGTTLWTESSPDTHVTLPWDTTKTPNGPQTLTVTVQSSIRTGSASVDVTVQNGETGKLTASFTSPPADAIVSDTTTVGMAASGAAPGNITYKLAIDGAVVSVQTIAATSASYAWDTRTYSDAAHTLTLTVTDSAGAVATATRTVTVNNGATGSLTVALTTPRPGETVSGTVWANVWVNPGGT
ncbi:MAG TPA: galactose oxidase-like domain-containing protein, partial [Methylomirabilota bacterium]|nr:galactose oxidase-like domain-containing protein [Methylomirabilota bacterium]